MKNLKYYVVIAFVAVLGIGFGVIAYTGQNAGTVFEGDCNNCTTTPVESSTSGDVNLGAVSGGDFYTPVTFYDKVGIGEGRQSTNYFVKAIKFTDATITPVLFNPDAEGYQDFYLVDAWLEIDGKATTTARVAVSTTTATVMTQETIRPLLTAGASTATLGAFLSNEFGADGALVGTETATSSQLSIFSYPGTNTRINNRTYPKIPSTTNIVVVATTSDYLVGGYGINGANETFDGTLYIVGRETNR